MREILFRGKDATGVLNYSWVVGVLDNTDKHSPKISYLDRFGNKIIAAVAPETIGQFTGIYDKNGKRIFEGDMVSYKGDEHAAIIYDEETARFCVGFDTWSTDFDHLYGKELEVIGNVHDNPELLEERAE